MTSSTPPRTGSTPRRFALALACVLLGAGLAQRAQAQEQTGSAASGSDTAPGSTSGGGATTNRTYGGVSIYEAWDQDRLQTLSVDSPTPVGRQSGFYTAGDFLGRYQRRMNRAQFDVSGEGIGRYFPDLTSGLVERYEGSARLVVKPALHTSFSATALGRSDEGLRTFRASGSSQGLTSGDLSQSAPLEPFQQLRQRVASATFKLTQSLSSNTDVWVGYERTRSWYGSPSVAFDSQAPEAGVSSRFTRNLSGQARYTYYDWHPVGSTVHSRQHTVEGSLTYRRPLSANTDVFLSGGVLAISQKFSGSNQQVWARGTARLGHQFGPHWHGQAGYEHGVAYLNWLPDPVNYDSVDASVTGHIGSRLTLESLVYAWYGKLTAGTSTNNSSYRVWNVATFELCRWVNLFAAHEFLRGRYFDNRLVAPGASSNTQRNIVYAGFTVGSSRAPRY